MTDPGASGDGVPAPLADHVERAAREHAADPGDVTALLARWIDGVRTYPGVADLVFEYRRAFSHDPLVDRDGDAYHLLVPPHVLPSFATALDADAEGAAWAAARATHRRALVAATGVTDHGDWEPLVLVAQPSPTSRSSPTQSSDPHE